MAGRVPLRIGRRLQLDCAKTSGAACADAIDQAATDPAL